MNRSASISRLGASRSEGNRRWHRFARRAAMACCLAALVGTAIAADIAADDGPVLQSARRAGAIDEVTVSLEAAGECSGDLSEIGKPSDPKADKTPMNVVANLRYFEKTGPAAGDGVDSSLRHYALADAKLKIGKNEFTRTLRPERAYIAVACKLPDRTVFSPQGPLTREELDLLEQVGDSILLDGLLPDGPVSKGRTWKLADEHVAALLCMDQVTKHDIQGTITEIAANVVRFEFAGQAAGRKNDTTSQVEIKAKSRFDLRLKRVDWLGLVAKVHREAGAVEAGFDVSLKLSVRVVPQAKCEELDAAAIKDFELKPTAENTALQLDAVGGDWRLIHDRDWFTISYHRDIATLRMLHDGEYLVQCSVTPLPKRPPDNLPSLNAFRQDVQDALGKRFGEIVAASQSVSDEKYRVLRLVVDGKVEDAAKQWRYYHLANPEGRQVVFAMNIDGKSLEKFDDADIPLAAGFRFLEVKAAKK